MYYDELKTHRITARLKIATLARMCGVNRATIARIEKHHPTTIETGSIIVDKLNEHYFAKPWRGALEPNAVLTKKSRFGNTEE